MKRTSFVFLITFLLLGGIIFAEGSKESNTASKNAVELRLLVNANTNTEPGSLQVEYYDYIEKEILDNYGLAVDFKVTMASTNDIADMVNLLVASRQIDTWKFNKNASMLAEDDFLAPLNDAIEAYGSNIRRTIAEEQKWQTVTVDNEIRAIPFYNGQIPNKGFWIRKDVYEEVGLEYSEVITISEFEEFLERGKEAYPDLIPLGRTVRPYHWFAETMNALGEPVEKANLKGEPKPYLLGRNIETARYVWDDEYVKRLELLNKWWEAGYMHPEWFSWSRADAISIVEQGVCLAVAGGWGRHPIYSNLYTTQGQEWKFTIITQDDGRAVLHDRRSWDSVAVMVLKGRPGVAEGVVALIDWLYTDIDNNFSGNFGQKGVHWDYDDDGYVYSLLTEDGRFEEHSSFINGVLGLSSGPYRKEKDALHRPMGDSEPYDTQYDLALEPSPLMVASSPVDAWTNYGELELMIQERGLTYNPSDAGTYIHEIELKATLGEITPQEGQKLLQEYAEKSGWKEWWEARMEVFNKNR